jgi:glycosyltransferase involved in cell wall biosynthesis
VSNSFMKILRAIRSMDPQGGGVASSVQAMSIALKNHGHKVEIVSLDSPTAPWVINAPILIHALGPVQTSYGYTSKYVPWLKQHVQEYDAVIIEGLWQYHSFGAWRALRHSHIPYWVFSHGMLGFWFKQQHPLKHLKKWLYWPWAEYQVLRDAKAVFFTCEEERLSARKSFWLYQCNEKVINLGTSIPLEATKSSAKFLEKFPQLQNKRLLLFLGRIHPIKGCDLLIQAFASVAKQEPNLPLHLVLAGPDPRNWQTKLKQMVAQLAINHQVTWTGLLDNQLKWGALSSSEVLILPSHHENFGMVVAEAMACRKPVLISNQVGIWREIEQDNAGIVAPDTLEGTIQLLKQWLAIDSSEQVNMGKNAHTSFLNRFEINKVADNFLAVMKLEDENRFLSTTSIIT